MSDEKERATAFADAMAEIEEKLYSGKMTINQARIKPGFKPLEGCGCLVISKSELIEPNESESEYFKKLINAKFEDNPGIIEITYSSVSNPTDTKNL